jgi:hypothetical protein
MLFLLLAGPPPTTFFSLFSSKLSFGVRRILGPVSSKQALEAVPIISPEQPIINKL